MDLVEAASARPGFGFHGSLPGGPGASSGAAAARQPRPALVHRQQSGFLEPSTSPAGQSSSSCFGSSFPPLLLPASPVLAQHGGKSALSQLMAQLSTPPMRMPLASPAPGGVSLSHIMQPRPSSPSDFFNFSAAAGAEKTTEDGADAPTDYLSSRSCTHMADADMTADAKADLAAAAASEARLGLVSAASTSSFAPSSMDSLTFTESTSSPSPAPSSPFNMSDPSTALCALPRGKSAWSAADPSEAREEPAQRQFLNREELLSLSPYHTSILQEAHAEARRRAVEIERAEQEQTDGDSDGDRTMTDAEQDHLLDYKAPQACQLVPVAATNFTSASTSPVDSAFNAMLLTSPLAGHPEHFHGMAAFSSRPNPEAMPQGQVENAAPGRIAETPAQTQQSSAPRRPQPRPQPKRVEDDGTSHHCLSASKPTLRGRGRAGSRTFAVSARQSASEEAAAKSANSPDADSLQERVAADTPLTFSTASNPASATSPLPSGLPAITCLAPQADFYKATSGSASQRAKQLGTFPADEAFATSLEQLTAGRIDRRSKPTCLWWSLIRAAILGSPEGRLQMETLCATISEHFPWVPYRYYFVSDRRKLMSACDRYFGRAKEAKNWKSSIRSVIHTKPCFYKTEDPTTGAVWWHVDVAVDPREQRRGLKKRSSVSSGGDEAEGSSEARKRARTAVQEAMAGTVFPARVEIEEAEASASEMEDSRERRATLRGRDSGENGAQRKKRRRTQ